MRSRGLRRWLSGIGGQVGLATAVAAAALAWQASQLQTWADLWLTRNQQGRRAFAAREYKRAVALFEDPTWKGVAAYRAGLYDASAEAFGRVATAQGFFNRGDALMKGRNYRAAIDAYELAVTEAPDWIEARENLELAIHVRDWIERVREQSDTGDESELSADDFKFDNEEKKGRDIEITRDSTIGLESAEKWMRTVDTETRDFLRTRFLLEDSLAEKR